jgi:hypothetical protein
MVPMAPTGLNAWRPIATARSGLSLPDALWGRWPSPRCFTVPMTPHSQNDALRLRGPDTASSATDRPRTATAPPARRCAKTETRA